MNNMRRTFGSREVRLYEMSCRFFSRAGPCCYDDRRTALQKPARDGLARALRAAGDQDAFAPEFTRVIRICTRCSHGFLLDPWTVLTVVNGALAKQRRYAHAAVGQCSGHCFVAHWTGSMLLASRPSPHRTSWCPNCFGHPDTTVS